MWLIQCFILSVAECIDFTYMFFFSRKHFLEYVENLFRFSRKQIQPKYGKCRQHFTTAWLSSLYLLNNCEQITINNNDFHLWFSNSVLSTVKLLVKYKRQCLETKVKIKFKKRIFQLIELLPCFNGYMLYYRVDLLLIKGGFCVIL